MPDIPTSLATFAALLDAQPEPVRQAFNYCLALMMVEAGKARLIETLPGEAGQVCVFPRRGSLATCAAPQVQAGQR
jgi:hypothetical protein